MKFYKKTISILLVHAFLLSSLPIAALRPALAVPSDNPLAKGISAFPDNVVISKEYGIVRSRFTGTSDKFIIHIQDAHCNYEAQSNIAKIIEGLIKNNALSFVSVEGADGIIDTSWFKSFPDNEVRKEVANYFMKKGEITGPEFLSITTNHPIKLYGAETREYYIQNLNAFTSSYPLKEATEKYLNQIKAVLNKLKGFIYSDELRAIDSKAGEHEANTIQFNDYVRFLQAMAEKTKINVRQYENLFKLINVLAYEKKIDFSVTDKERSALIDELSRTVAKNVLTELVNQSISFKVGKVSSDEYYGYIKDLAAKSGIDLSKKYPNLYNYIIYNSVYSKIDNEKLFQDIKALETAIKEKLFENDDQRTLEKFSRHIDMLLGLVNIKLLNDDFEYYKTHKNEFALEIFGNFIKDKSVQFGIAYEMSPPADTVASNIEKLEDFYAIAIKRDKAMVDNTLEGMSNADQKMAVLVTGGFHSEGMAKLLEGQGISYIVVCPNITKDVPTPYMQVLTNKRTSFEEILVGAKDMVQQGMLAPALISREMKFKSGAMNKAVYGKMSDMMKPNPDMDARVERVKNEWIRRHLTIWLGKGFKYAAAQLHRFVNRQVMWDAYRMAMERSALDANPSLSKEDLKKQVDEIMSAEAFNTTFDKVYGKITSGASVIDIVPKTDLGRGAFRLYSRGLNPEEHATYNEVVGALLDEDRQFKDKAYSLLRNYGLKPGSVILRVAEDKELSGPERALKRLFKKADININIVPGLTNVLYSKGIRGVLAHYHTQSRTVDIDDDTYAFFISLSRSDCAELAGVDVGSDKVSSGLRIIAKIIYHDMVHIDNPIKLGESLDNYERRIDDIIIARNRKYVITDEERGILLKYHSISDAEAFASEDKFEQYIRGKVTARLASIRRHGKKIIKETVGVENAYPHPLIPGKAFYLDDFRDKAINAARFIDDTERLVLEGGVVNQFLFAGSATRLKKLGGGSAKYFVNGKKLIEENVEALRKKVDGFNLTDSQRSAIDAFITDYEYDADKIKKEKEDDLKKLGINMERIDDILDTFVFYRVIYDMRKNEAFKKLDDIELGAREVIQYRVALEALAASYAKKHGLVPQGVIDNAIKNAKLIVHVNDQTSEMIMESFGRWNFFGFQRENVVFIVCPTFAPYRLEDKKLVKVDKTDKKKPFGHGYTLMQTVEPSTGKTIGPKGEEIPIAEAPLEYLKKRGAMLMTNANIDDLTKLIPMSYNKDTKEWEQLPSAALDILRLAQAMYLMKNNGANVVVEGVENFKGQKGGSWWRDTVIHREMLVEGNALTDHMPAKVISTGQIMLIRKHLFNKDIHQELVGEEADRFWKEQVLLNKMANIYKIDAMLRYLPGHGLPNYLDLREEGLLYLESITGDVTQIPEMKAAAFAKKGERILTFKGVSDTKGTLMSMLAQDIDPAFKDMVNRLRSENGAPASVIADTAIGKELFRPQEVPQKEVTQKEWERMVNDRAYFLSLENPSSKPGDNWTKAAAEISLKFRVGPGSVGAIREKGGGLSEIEHREGELSVNATIKKLIEDRQAYVLFRGVNAYRYEDRLIPTGEPVSTKMNDLQRANLINLLENESIQKMKFDFIILQGLRSALPKNVADLVFHPGRSRRAVYLDEKDLLDLLSLENNSVYLILQAVNHEIAHIENPDMTEAEAEAKASTTDVRKELASRKVEEVRKWLKSIGMLETDIHKYSELIAKYGINIDVSGLKDAVSTIAMLKAQEEIPDDVTVIVAEDTTGASEGTKKAMQFGAQFIEEHLGDSVVCIRKEGGDLVSAVETKVKELQNKGRKFAVVVSGKNISVDTENKMLSIINSANNAMQAREGTKPMSALLKIADTEDISIAVLQSLSLRIGFNLGEENILSFLRSVAIMEDGKPFGPEDLADLLKKGFLALRPLRPIDLRAVDEAHRAEAAVLRSM